jgi:outer membrane protein TolC
MKLLEHVLQLQGSQRAELMKNQFIESLKNKYLMSSKSYLLAKLSTWSRYFYAIVFIEVLWSQMALAQDNIMPYQEFLGFVKQNHPILKQAALFNNLANEELRMQRGNFDPKAEMLYHEKVFKNKPYFYHWNNQLKIPTWTGADFKAGYERNDGPFLDSEFDTDGGKGYWYAGISVPIGQGLFIDARRTVVRQAQALQTLNEAERVKLTNKTILEAAKDYWLWFFKYHQVRLLQKAYDLAVQRFEIVKLSVRQGDIAPLDSLEAKIAIQNREINLRMAENELNNARLFLSIHLWDNSFNPLELPASIAPPEASEIRADTVNIDALLELAKQSHPELIKLAAKARQLELDRRLAAENIKPLINLEYTTLLGKHAAEVGSRVAVQDYKLSARFSMPLLLRKERSKLQMSKIKIEQNQLETNFQNIKILNELKAAHNDLKVITEMIVNQRDIVENYRKLTNGEVLKFTNGESSFFMVNLRESVWFESQVKLFDMEHKLGKAMATLLWAAGVGF